MGGKKSPFKLCGRLHSDFDAAINTGVFDLIVYAVFDRTIMNSKTRNKCKFCGVILSRPDSLKRHINTFHSESDGNESCESSQSHDSNVCIPRRILKRIVEILEQHL